MSGFSANEPRVGAVRWVYLAAGMSFVGIGSLGLIVPGLPSTVFFILALWAFKRSSPRMESWLLNHRIVGPTLRDWDENKSIKRRTKIVAIATICLFIGVSIVLLPKVWLKLTLGAIALLVSLYIWTRQESAQELEAIELAS